MLAATDMNKIAERAKADPEYAIQEVCNEILGRAKKGDKDVSTYIQTVHFDHIHSLLIENGYTVTVFSKDDFQVLVNIKWGERW